MHTPPFVTELVVVFGVALLVVLVLSRLRLPTIAGFIAAGALLGPHGLGLVEDPGRIESLAEVGVVLLLFTIGLEFSLERIRRLWKALLWGGGLQVGLTVLFVLILSVLVGHTLRRGVFFGLLVSLSSTAIVLRALAERQETDAPHGRLIVGALVFQDLCVVPMMLVVPMLGGQETSLAAIAAALGKAAGLVAGTIVLGRFLIPRLLKIVAAARHRELFMLAVLLLCIGISWLTSLAGLSLALGAFLAGMALADSEYGQQAMADVLPFRETLTSLFFVSIGMLFDVDVVIRTPLLLGGMVAAVLVGKAAVATMSGLAMKFPLRVAVLSGIGLAQIGEFSFVLEQVGRDTGLLSADEGRHFIAMSVITMIVTPLAFRFGPHVAAGAARLRRLERMLGAPGVERSRPTSEALEGHVVIAGYGVAGRLLGEALREVGISFIVVEINAETVRAARARGEPAYYGDVTSREILDHASLRLAREFVILINDPEAARRAVVAARSVAPKVPIVVRTRYVRDIELLRRLGAVDVIAEEFETSVEVIARVLRAGGVPANVIHERIRHSRRAGAAIERPVTVPRRMLGEIHELRELKIESFLVRPEDWAAGRTLAEFHLVLAGGAMVVALAREGATRMHPRAFEELRVGDVVYLVGEDTSAALRLLARGPEELAVEAPPEASPPEGPGDGR